MSVVVEIRAVPDHRLDWWFVVDKRCFYVCGIPAVEYAPGRLALRGAAVEHAELLVAGYVVRLGLVSPASFRWMRRVLGLGRGALGVLLAVTDATIERWEDGVTQLPFMAWSLVAALVLDALHTPGQLLDHLRIASSPEASEKALGLLPTFTLTQRVPRGVSRKAFVVPYEEPRAK